MDAPALAVSRDGKRWACAWMDRRAQQDRVWLRFGGEGAADRDEQISPAEVRQNHPQIALDGKGALWAVWEEGSAGRTRIAGRRAGAKTPETLGEEAEGAATHPVIATLPDGGAVVAYEVKGDIVVRRWPAP